jgi:hypothetical protein
MVKVISHRGNINGPNEKRENNPKHIEEAILLGLDVEIDFWFNRFNQKFFLGHDKPEYTISYKWLEKYKNKLWIHCKTLFSLRYFYDSDFNYFWHQDDDFTLTSKGYIWTYPNKEVTDKSVIVCRTKEEQETMFKKKPFAICTDYYDTNIH